VAHLHGLVQRLKNAWILGFLEVSLHAWGTFGLRKVLIMWCETGEKQQEKGILEGKRALEWCLLECFSSDFVLKVPRGVFWWLLE
jgi:hypothetical protein